MPDPVLDELEAMTWEELVDAIDALDENGDVLMELLEFMLTAGRPDRNEE